MSPLAYLKLDLRRDKRVPIRLPVLVAREGRKSVPHILGRIVDLSRGGIRMYTDTAFSVGDRLSMLIQVGQQGEDIGGLAEVAWIRPAKQFDLFSEEIYVMGIRFLEINCEGRTLLARLVEKRLGKTRKSEIRNQLF